MSGETADSGGAAVVGEINRIFRRCGARGFVSISEIGRSDNRIDVDGDEQVAVASVVKVLLAVAYARAVSGGAIDPQERVTVPARYRLGGAGTAGCLDPVEMSVRDLALFMMSMSDNAATDLVYRRVGPAAIDAVVRDLELSDTWVRHDMEGGALTVVADLGFHDARALDAQLAGAHEAAVRDLAWIDPARTNASTPRQVGRLLESIWTDRAGTSEACAHVRELMSHQIAAHRLASGFPYEEVTIASKTGTLPSIRNEAGVVTFPGGRSFVASIFARSASLSDRQPAVDAAIGHVASLGVAYLRGR